MAYHTDVAKQRKKNGIQTERKADKLKKAPPKATRENIAVPLSTVENAIRRKEESPRQRVTKSPSRESQMPLNERNDRYGQIARGRKITNQFGEKTGNAVSSTQAAMYRKAFSGPPSKEEQERLRKENSRRAAQEAAARGQTGRGRR